MIHKINSYNAMDLGVLGTIFETSIKYGYEYDTYSGVSGDLGLSHFLVFFSIEIRGCKWAYKLLVSKLELMLKILMKKGCAKLFYGGMLDYFRKTTPLEEAKSE